MLEQTGIICEPPGNIFPIGTTVRIGLYYGEILRVILVRDHVTYEVLLTDVIPPKTVWVEKTLFKSVSDVPTWDVVWHKEA